MSCMVSINSYPDWCFLWFPSTAILTDAFYSFHQQLSWLMFIMAFINSYPDSCLSWFYQHLPWHVFHGSNNSYSDIFHSFHQQLSWLMSSFHQQVSWMMFFIVFIHQCLQSNVRRAHQLCHDCFLPHPFQFTGHPTINTLQFETMTAS